MLIKKLSLLSVLLFSLQSFAGPVRPNSRHWLYWMERNSPHFILTDEVKSNLNFYVHMIENHIEKLERKTAQQNALQAKKATKAAACIGLAIASSQALNWVWTLPIMENKNLEMFYVFSSVAFWHITPLSTFFGGVYTYKSFSYKQRLQKRLERDKRVLKLLLNN